MKCFERLVMSHIRSCLPINLDPLQFTYKANRSTEDAISTLLHLTLTHLENKNTYIRISLIDFSSAFNNILPQQLVEKLLLLGLDSGVCMWIMNFLTEHQQTVRVGSLTSKTVTVSTGTPQGCVLSPLLFTLLTYDCTASFNSNHVIKFADDTTVVGLITDNDEKLTALCTTHNLALNTNKTKEIVIDFRRVSKHHHLPLTINSSEVKRVKSTKFLGIHLTNKLTTRENTSAVIKKAQQRLHCLRRLKKVELPIPAMTLFYRGTVESLLTYCISYWFCSCTVEERHNLSRIVRTAEKIIGVSLPQLQDIYTERCVQRAGGILKDCTHSFYGLFTLMQSGKRYRSIKTRKTRLLNSFLPTAVRLLNQSL
uniref:Reverse transcriptase domain-containing protein n=1 Tax=Cyprinus carpio TaxID=7962 RepID=A0A8C1TE37_CYPCA